MLLTNDGQWSRSLPLPQSRLPKRYRVTVEQPLLQAHVETFRNGFHFAHEDIRTRSAGLSIPGEFQAEVSLMEGRHDPIRRMFGHLGVRVLGIQRFAVDDLVLDAGLEPARSRALTPVEVDGMVSVA